MFAPPRSVVIVGSILAAACGTPAGVEPPGDGGHDGGGECAPLDCPAAACGFSVDACGQTLDCSCAYASRNVVAGGTFDVASRGDEVVVVDHLRRQRLQSGSLTTTEFDAGVLPQTATFLEAALAPDGAVWVVAGSLGSAVVASDSSGALAAELSLSTPHVAADVAVLPDGTVGVLSGAPTAVVLRTRAPGGAWQQEPLQASTGSAIVKGVALAAGTAGFWAAWVDDQGVVRTRSPAGGQVALEERAAVSLVGGGRRLALAVDPGGAPHLIFPGSAGLTHASFDGAWVVSPLPRFTWSPLNYAFGMTELALAAGSDGTLALAVHSSFTGNVRGVSLLRRVGARWFAQPVVGDDRCDEDSRLGVAVTSRGAFLATSCGRAVEQAGRLAAGFREACVDLVQQASGRARECSLDAGTSMDCTRYEASSSSGRFCGGNSRLAAAFCGDPTRSLPALTDCAGTLSTATCSAGANLLGPACSSFFDAASP